MWDSRNSNSDHITSIRADYSVSEVFASEDAKSDEVEEGSW